MLFRLLVVSAIIQIAYCYIPHGCFKPEDEYFCLKHGWKCCDHFHAKHCYGGEYTIVKDSAEQRINEAERDCPVTDDDKIIVFRKRVLDEQMSNDGPDYSKEVELSKIRHFIHEIPADMKSYILLSESDSRTFTMPEVLGVSTKDDPTAWEIEWDSILRTGRLHTRDLKRHDFDQGHKLIVEKALVVLKNDDGEPRLHPDGAVVEDEVKTDIVVSTLAEVEDFMEIFPDMEKVLEPNGASPSYKDWRDAHVDFPEIRKNLLNNVYGRKQEGGPTISFSAGVHPHVHAAGGAAFRKANDEL